MKKLKWTTQKRDKTEKEKLLNLTSDKRLKRHHTTVIEVLFNRGYQTVEEILDFFDNDPTKVHNPMLMTDMEIGVKCMIEALNAKKHIVVYGDYDCDGASSTAIAVLGLKKLGARVDYFINNRFKHGYGIKKDGVEDLLLKYPTVDLIITVDNGIVAYEGIDFATSKGIDIIVTDHHDPHPSGEMPKALAVINPKRPGDKYPFKGLCGASVIHKFMLALYWELDKDLDYVDEMIDIVGMATIGDVMPLEDENRIFVKEALKSIEQNSRLAFSRLVDKTEISTINEEMFGFKFVPMINAPSRLLGDIDLAVDLFLTEGEQEIDRIIDELIKLNEKRKELTLQQEKLAMSMIESLGEQPVYVLYHPDFHEGIVGLVAGRIKESFHRPAIVLTEHNGVAKGSGRSIEGFHVNNALHEIQNQHNLLIGFGGHAMACGMSLDVTKIDSLRDRLSEMAQKQLSIDDMTPKIKIDTVVTANDLNIEYIEELDTLRPFGQAFEKPKLLLYKYQAQKVIFMGQEENHVKVQGAGDVDIIMFNYAEYFKEHGEFDSLMAIGYPGLNVFNNKINVQFMVQDNNLRPSK